MTVNMFCKAENVRKKDAIYMVRDLRLSQRYC